MWCWYFDNQLKNPEIIKIPASQLLAGASQNSKFSNGVVSDTLDRLTGQVDNFNGSNGLVDAKQKLDNILAGNFGISTPTPPKTSYGDINPRPSLGADPTRIIGTTPSTPSEASKTPPKSGPIDKTARPVNLGENKTPNQTSEKRIGMNIKKVENSKDNKFKIG